MGAAASFASCAPRPMRDGCYGFAKSRGKRGARWKDGREERGQVEGESISGPTIVRSIRIESTLTSADGEGEAARVKYRSRLANSPTPGLEGGVEESRWIRSTSPPLRGRRESIASGRASLAALPVFRPLPFAADIPRPAGTDRVPPELEEPPRRRGSVPLLSAGLPSSFLSEDRRRRNGADEKTDREERGGDVEEEERRKGSGEWAGRVLGEGGIAEASRGAVAEEPSRGREIALSARWKRRSRCSRGGGGGVAEGTGTTARRDVVVPLRAGRRGFSLPYPRKTVRRQRAIAYLSYRGAPSSSAESPPFTASLSATDLTQNRGFFAFSIPLGQSSLHANRVRHLGATAKSTQAHQRLLAKSY
ncbi:hypothetical protein KM043_001509 [Ampulex compressa]|nr:hypothetical protein KM043_001509 [Ampulex compressa]